MTKKRVQSIGRRKLYNKKLPPKPVRPWQVRIYIDNEDVYCIAWSTYPRARAAAEKFEPGFHGCWKSMFYAVFESKKVVITPRNRAARLYREAAQWRQDHLAEVVLYRTTIGYPERSIASWWIEPELAEQKRDEELPSWVEATHARIYLPSGEVIC